MTVSKSGHAVVTEQEWVAARKEFLAKEKALTEQRDALSAERRELPWVKVDKNYLFDTPAGKQSLADLFGSSNQLIIYHFMLGPGWEAGCPSCSYLADHFDGAQVHLKNRDVTMVAVARAPINEVEAFKKRMGWDFKFVSSYGSDFNRDFNVSFTEEELASGKAYYNYTNGGFPSAEAPGMSVFIKESDGSIYHSYSAFARGLDIMVGVYNLLDIVPKGRDESELAWPMAWVRHHDR